MAYNEADQKVLAFIGEDIALGYKMRGYPVICRVARESYYRNYLQGGVDGIFSFYSAGKYTGEAKNDTFNGKGTWIDDKGEVRVDGEWEHGILRKGRLIDRTLLEGYQGIWKSGLDINKAGCKQRLMQVKIYYEKTKTVGESREPIFRKNRDWDDWRG